MLSILFSQGYGNAKQGLDMRRFKQGGFTLIELMVVVAIIAIIAAIGYPNYTSYVMRAKRSAAESFMVTVANRQEQAMLNSRTYFAVATAGEWATNAKMGIPGDVATSYTLTVTADNSVAPPSYTVTAAPLGTQTGDTKCANLTYNSVGAKGISGTGTVADCWK
jgi:type IV pilus assembly protein PilE